MVIYLEERMMAGARGVLSNIKINPLLPSLKN
jgi:hypothetical protein